MCADPPASTGDAVTTAAVLSDVISFDAAVSARRRQQLGAAAPPDVARRRTWRAPAARCRRLGVERDKRARLHALRDGLTARKSWPTSSVARSPELNAAVHPPMETVMAAPALLPMPRDSPMPDSVRDGGRARAGGRSGSLGP